MLKISRNLQNTPRQTRAKSKDASSGSGVRTTTSDSVIVGTLKVLPVRVVTPVFQAKQEAEGCMNGPSRRTLLQLHSHGQYHT
jgi:hypothetical protein